MNKEDLRSLLNKPYQFENWKNVIDFVFPNVSYLQQPRTIPTDNEKVESFRQVGSLRVNDGKNLAIFEVHVKPNVNIARNRVELRNLVAG
jgi:adenine-specific DNA-methyltransferase